MKTYALAGLLSIAGVIPSFADGQELDLSGQINLGFRYYTEDGQYSGQGPAGYYPFIGMQLNGAMGVGPGELVFQFDGLSDDANDRSVFNIQKAYYTQSFDSWDLVIGYNVEDWGVSSGRTIVNVLNARDVSDQVGSSGLIGTPMINANFFTGIGTFSAYVLGGDVSNNYGGQATRERGPFPTYGDFATYQNDDELDFALRYSNYFSVGNGSLDFGLSYYQGTNREAVRLPGCVTTSGPVTPAICEQMSTALRNAYEAGTLNPTSVGEIATVLINEFGIAVASEGPNVLAQVPYYQDIQQFGLTAVYAQGNTQFRFEGFVRETDFERFTAGIIGGDHTFYNIAGADGTLILALEYHFDDRSLLQPTTIFDDDAFLGLNYGLNDTNDSRVEFGLFHDLDTSAQLYSLTLSRRIGDRMRAQISASHVEVGSQPDPLTALDGDTFFEFTLSTFF